MKTEQQIKDKIEYLKKFFETNESYFNDERTLKSNTEINTLLWVLDKSKEKN